MSAPKSASFISCGGPVYEPKLKEQLNVVGLEFSLAGWPVWPGDTNLYRLVLLAIQMMFRNVALPLPGGTVCEPWRNVAQLILNLTNGISSVINSASAS